MINKNYIYNIGYWLGIGAYAGFLPLSFFIYPELKLKLSLIHALCAFYFIFARNLQPRLLEKYSLTLPSLSLIITGLGISLLCFFSEGLASFYFKTIFLVIITACIALHFSPCRFIIIIIILLIQHFAINILLRSWDLKNLLINLFLLISGGIIGAFVHFIVHNLFKEIKCLEGFIPICVKCKKIRDDKGYWNMMEQYIESRSSVEFTHGLCPDCIKIYEQEADEYSKKNKTKRYCQNLYE
jgi:hypothetical protein